MDRETFKSLGEFGLIERISRLKCAQTKSTELGIGDDCAIIPVVQDEQILVTTDSLIEGIHFLMNDIAPRDLGYKMLAVNLSDIAATGGMPKEAFLSLSLPDETPCKWIDQFLEGFEELALMAEVKLMGGNTTRSIDRVSMSTTLLGRSNHKKIKLRSGSKAGDYICVTGTIGDSAAGLDIILNHRERSLWQLLLERHYRPRPQVLEGQWLAQQLSIHSMIDLSDGIASDLRRITEKSLVGAKVKISSIPTSDLLRKYCKMYHLPESHFSIEGGEDYCLLFTVDPADYDSIRAQFTTKFGSEVYHIGTIENKEVGIQNV